MAFEGRVPTQGTQLWVEAVGEGAPVVLLHAGIAHSRMWDGQVAELRSRFNVIRYDVRGFGRSYSPDMEYVDHHDLASVMNHFSISSAILVGASNGGRIAVDFALENPDRIRGLFLIAPGIGGFATSRPVKEGWDAIEALEGIDDIEAAIEATLALWVDGPRRDASEVSVQARRAVAEMLRDNYGIPPEQDAGREAETSTARDRLESISAPLTVLVGECDHDEKLLVAKELASRVAGSRLVLMPGVAHMPSLEQPDAFGREFAEFLDTLD